MKKQNLLLVLAMALLAGFAFIGCGTDEDGPGLSGNSGSSDADSDTDSDSDSDTDSDADSDTDSDTDSDSDGDSTPTECDGADKDCYSDCWGCAINSKALCLPTVEKCIADEKCSAYYECKEVTCCGGKDDCLTGDDWEKCMKGCAETAKVTDETLKMYQEIDYCVACEACEISCAQGESADFAMCADPEEMNDPENPCYEKDAEPGEVPCFSWAGWGGPCTTAVTNCKNDDKCATLEECVNDTWQYDDWSVRQDDCFDDAGADAETLYWAYMQCIYCDACDVACLKDAGSKNCSDYESGK